MEKAIFLIVAACFVGVEIAILYHKPNIFFATVLIVSLLGFLAFYLFQYGSLESFSVEALSAKAKFIKQKAEEAQQDSEVIEALKNKNLEFTDKIQKILTDLEKSQQDINEYKNELSNLKREVVELEGGLVEINYLQYSGRNIFPNPYHERIIAKLNELLVIALPDPQKRKAYASELEAYTASKRPK